MSSRLERLILLDQELRRGLYPSVERLCRLLEVQPRALFQDIKDLRERLGLDIKFDRNRGGYYNATPEKALPTFSLTEEELFSVLLGAMLIRPDFDEHSKGIISRAILKLCAASTAEFAREPDLVFERLSTSEPAARAASNLELLHKVFAAACAGRQIAITVGGAEDETVSPVRIVRGAGSAWTMLATGPDGAEQSIPLSSRNTHIRTIK